MYIRCFEPFLISKTNSKTNSGYYRQLDYLPWRSGTECEWMRVNVATVSKCIVNPSYLIQSCINITLFVRHRHPRLSPPILGHMRSLCVSTWSTTQYSVRDHLRIITVLLTRLFTLNTDWLVGWLICVKDSAGHIRSVRSGCPWGVKRMKQETSNQMT